MNSTWDNPWLIACHLTSTKQCALPEAASALNHHVCKRWSSRVHTNHCGVCVDYAKKIAEVPRIPDVGVFCLTAAGLRIASWAFDSSDPHKHKHKHVSHCHWNQLSFWHFLTFSRFRTIAALNNTLQPATFRATSNSRNTPANTHTSPTWFTTFCFLHHGQIYDFLFLRSTKPTPSFTCGQREFFMREREICFQGSPRLVESLALSKPPPINRFNLWLLPKKNVIAACTNLVPRP